MRWVVVSALASTACSSLGAPIPPDPDAQLATGMGASDGHAVSLDAAWAAADAAEGEADLQLLGSAMAATVSVSDETFPPDHCAVTECLGGAGTRRLLRFDTASANLGTADAKVGTPSIDSPLWQYDRCHDHWHYRNFTGVPSGTYRLRVEVNPLRAIDESNYDNNSVEIPVTL